MGYYFPVFFLHRSVYLVVFVGFNAAPLYDTYLCIYIVLCFALLLCFAAFI